MHDIVIIRGKGRFFYNDGVNKKNWSSNLAWVRFKLNAAQDKAVCCGMFGQRPEGIDTSRWVLPKFSKKEFERMRQLALEYLYQRLEESDDEESDDEDSDYEDSDEESDDEEDGIEILDDSSRQPHHMAECERCEQLGFSCTGHFTVVYVEEDEDGDEVELEDRYKLSRAVHWKRKNALDSGPIVTLYHQTSPEAAAEIIETQTMFRGKKGALGPGIYFADTPEATDRKARSRGVILACDVKLGNMYEVDEIAEYSFHDLLRCGYHSLCCTDFNSGPEYVVYNWDQVTNIRVLRLGSGKRRGRGRRRGRGQQRR